MRSALVRIAHPKGIDEQWRQDPAAADLIVDMRWDPMGAWQTCGGYHALPLSGAGWPAGVVHSMHWFSQHNGGRQWLVHEMTDAGGNLNLYAWGGWNGGARVTIASGRTLKDGPWSRTQYLAVGSWLLYINGIDGPQRWNGDFTTRIGFDRAPPPPTVSYLREQDWWPRYLRNYWALPTDAVGNAEDQRGVGPHPTQPGTAAVPPNTMTEYWIYGYAYTWLNDLGAESPLSEVVFVRGTNVASNATDVMDGYTHVQITFPAAPENARGVRLYRTENVKDMPAGEGERHATLYRHSEYGFGDTMTVVDGKHDEELGARFDGSRLGAFPRDATVMALFRGTLFLGCRDELRYSAPTLLEQFPPDNVFRLGDRDSGAITALHATRSALMVFKRRGIYIVRWTGDRFVAETLSEEIGSGSPNAIVDVPGLGVMFLSDEGVYALVGDASSPGTPTGLRYLGAPIERTWKRRVNTSALAAAVGCLYRRDHEVWFQVPADGDDRPTIGLVYHTNIGQWSQRLYWPVSAMVETRDHRGYLFFGSYTTTVPGIYHYGGYASKGAVALAGYYLSAWMEFGSGRAMVHYVNPLVVGNGTIALAFNHRRDRLVTFDRTNLSHAQESTEDAHPAWGTALWSTSEVWDLTELVELTYSVDQPHAQEFQYLFTGARLCLVAVDIHCSTDKPNFLPLEAGVAVEKV